MQVTGGTNNHGQPDDDGSTNMEESKNMWRIKVLTHLTTSKEMNKQLKDLAVHEW